ncbi:MAG: trimethylamine methyltransferase family protein [Caldilineaceae bacterium]|nr:trimethylamine methyltransferase family protein [Caldilineaceae bacterium]
MTLTASADRRAARRARRAQSPFAQIPFGRIQNHFAPFEVITPEQVEQLHEASMHILENIGIVFMDAEALSLWEQAGAQVDHASQNVRFDRGLILDLVAKAPAQFTWRARNPAREMTVGGDFLMFAPNGGVIFAQDLEGGRRPGTLEDYYNFLRLAQLCPVLHTTGDQLVVPHDVPVSFRHLHRSFGAWTLCDKVAMEAPHGRIIPADAIEMANIVFGADVATFDEPVLGGIINSSSPLRYDDRMLGGMITYGRAGQVLIITPFVLAGAMSPITIASAVAQQNAEALAGIAFVQLLRPGAPVIYGGFTSNIDMKSGAPAFGTPEGAWAMAIGAQLARRYNLPYRGSGSLNTSKAPDAQAAYETMWTTWPAVLAHTNFVMHAVGWLDGGLTVSYEKIIIDMENLAMFQTFLGGLAINEETLALDMIAAVPPGGHHFGTPHTQARYATEFHPTFLADRQNFELWQENGSLDTAQRANRIWKQLLEEYEAPPIDPAVEQALREFVERRERELAGVELYT